MKHHFLDISQYAFKTQNGNKDIETSTCSISIPDNIGLTQTVNIPAELKLCVGARVMLTDVDRLINSSTGTVKHLDRRAKPLCITIYVIFDDSKVFSSLNNRLHGELNQLLLAQRGFV